MALSNLALLMDLADEFSNDAVHPYFGSDFGLGLSPHTIHRQPLVGYAAPLSLLSRLSERQASRRGQSGENRVSPIGKDGFQVCLDVAQFKPSELNVKVVDNCIVVEGKHEEREDNHGFIERHFVRRYVLPKGYDADKVVSTLSSDGVLTVSVPKPQIEQKANERVVQIQQTGPAHLNVKQNTQEKVGDASNGGAQNDAKK